MSLKGSLVDVVFHFPAITLQTLQKKYKKYCFPLDLWAKLLEFEEKMALKR